MKKKYAMTLLEIMIVIFLIGIISSIVGYNIKGALDKGKEFKVETAERKIRDILLMEAAKIQSIDRVVKEPLKYLEISGLVDKPKELIKDPWGQTFVIKANKSHTDIIVYSEQHKKVMAKRQKEVISIDEEEY